MAKSEKQPVRTIVESVGRENVALLPFMEDTRINSLLTIPTPDGNVYVKPVAFPYTTRHLLIIPDARADAAGEIRNMPGILDVPHRQLQTVFSTAGKVAEHALKEHDVQQVDIGWNFSVNETKKVIASQMNNLHVHVNAMTTEDLAHPVPPIRSDKTLQSEIREPMFRVVNQIMDKIVFAKFAQDPRYIAYFERVNDGHERVTHRMKRGLDALQEPDFISLMEDIHERTITAYFELADCFFIPSTEPTRYQKYQVWEEDGRYKRLHPFNQVEKLSGYLARYELSEKAENRLIELLVKGVQTPKGQDVNNKLNRNNIMVNGPAFSTVFTGIKGENDQVEWRMGIDPVVFSTRDFLQASRGTEILFRRTPGVFFNQETLAQVQKWEQGVLTALTKPQEQ